MKRIQLLVVAGCLLPALGAFGQAPPPPVEQTSHHDKHGTKQQVADYINDAYPTRLQSQTVHYGYSVSGEAAGGAYSQSGYYPGYQYGAQYSGQYGAQYAGQYGGYGYCPHGMAGGQCQSCFPKHRYSSAYNVPRNLVYPAPQSTGGAVVYPYYTHKGPSDFFRK